MQQTNWKVGDRTRLENGIISSGVQVHNEYIPQFITLDALWGKHPVTKFTKYDDLEDLKIGDIVTNHDGAFQRMVVWLDFEPGQQLSLVELETGRAGGRYSSMNQLREALLKINAIRL